MYVVLSKIDVEQVTPFKTPTKTINRNRKFTLRIMVNYEINSSWSDLTQTMKITLPKNITFKDDGSNIIQLANTYQAGSNLGGFNDKITPLFMRGDIITFNAGYRAIMADGSEKTYMTGEDGIPNMFKGFISLVSPKLPFTIECEDYMWLCKQIPTPAQDWGKRTLQYVINKIIDNSKSLPLIQKYSEHGIDIKVSDFSKTDLFFNVGHIMTAKGTLAQFLARLKNQYKVDSYFRGHELRVGLVHYIPEDSTTSTFTFQKNIIADKLSWQRRDDTQLSAIIKSHYAIEDEDGAETADGIKKQKMASSEIIIYNNPAVNSSDPSATKWEKLVKGVNKDYDTKGFNELGERFTFNYYSADLVSAERLFEVGSKQIQKYYYDGFKGSFTTFGIPLVRHGDTVKFVDAIIQERQGSYKVKAVRYYGGAETGLRQDITLDYKFTS